MIGMGIRLVVIGVLLMGASLQAAHAQERETYWSVCWRQVVVGVTDAGKKVFGRKCYMGRTQDPQSLPRRCKWFRHRDLASDWRASNCDEY